MAHFAKLDDNNIVVQVIVVHNNELIDENGNESEAKGIAFCQNLFGGNWVQTSYSGSFRKRYAAIGHVYNSDLDAFIPQKPYDSWLFDEEKYTWKAPINLPEDAFTGDPMKVYNWDETIINWVLQQPL